MVLGKAKGNQEERKQAKILSNWMFDDPNTLKRQSDSGALKDIYCGDIIPIKQINWSHFPFMIEIKSGYEEHIPTFWSYSKPANWYIKAVEEGKIHNQYIIFLICQFLNKQALLFTNYQLDLNKIYPNIIIPIPIENDLHWIFIYNLKWVLDINFMELFNKEINYR